MLVRDFNWDELSTDSIWAFGPSDQGANMLMDYTLNSEVDNGRLGQVKNSIVQGFQWATREGPLCEEQMMNTKFKLLHGEFAPEAVFRSGG